MLKGELPYLPHTTPSAAILLLVTGDCLLLHFKLDHLPKRSHIIQLRLILLRLETDDPFGDPHPNGTDHQLHPTTKGNISLDNPV
jgi:hypothetical protein